MADTTSPSSQSVLPNELRDAVAHIYGSENPVAFHGLIPVATIIPAHPPQGIDYPHGGYFYLDYVGGGTAEAYGDQILVSAGRMAGVA